MNSIRTHTGSPNDSHLLFTSDKAREDFDTLIRAFSKTKNPKFIRPSLYFREKYAFWPKDPVSCVRWINDPEYFGHIGVHTFPKVKEGFIAIMERENRPLRLVLGGAIGWGKTFLTCLIMARLIYELVTLRNPQAYYGLAPGTPINLMNLSVTRTHARYVLFNTLKDMLDGSVWFRKYCPRRSDIESIIDFPQRNISFVPGSSSELAPLGANLFGGVIEEANFFPVVVGSRKSRNPDEREWDQAKKLHDAVWRRMKSRYQKHGRVPGMLVLNSSAKYPDDFLEKVIKENDPNTEVISYATWDTKPQDWFSGDKFYIFIGDRFTRPRVLETQEEVEKYRGKGMIKEVPIEYKHDFEVDIEGAIRDIMGVNIRSLNRFFTNLDALEECVDPSLPVPFSQEFAGGIVATDLPIALNLKKLINPIVRMKKSPPRPLINPDAPRFCHIDLGTTNDACGICIGHIAEVKEVKRRQESDEKIEVVQETAPVIVADLVLRIIPPLDEEIQIEDVRQILYDLQQLVGFRFVRITYDQWQSKDSMQLLKRRFGADIVGYLSVDRTDDQYNVLKVAINEGRFKCYHYEPFFREVRQLIRDPKTGKVDHPANGSKDVADAVAGMVWNATTYEMWMTAGGEPLQTSVQPAMTDEEKAKADFVKRLMNKEIEKSESELDDEALMRELDEGLDLEED